MTTDSSAQPPPPDVDTDAEGPSWWSSLTLAVNLWMVVRVIGWLIHDPDHAWKAQVGFCVFALLFERVRTAVLRFGIISAVVIVLVHAAMHPEDLRRDGLVPTARTALSTAFMGAMRRSAEFIVTSRRQPYLRAVHVVRDASTDPVLALSDQLTRACGNGEYDCEIESIVEAVHARVVYRSDPAGADADSIQAPITTWQREAGDCEDQAILVLSLLRAHGIKSYAAFSPHHMFAVACAAPDSDARNPRSEIPCTVVDTTDRAVLKPLSSLRRYGDVNLYDARGQPVRIP